MSEKARSGEWFKIFEFLIVFLIIPTVIFYIIAPHWAFVLKFGYYFIVSLFVFQAALSYLYSLSAFRSSARSHPEIKIHKPVPKTTFIVSAYLPNEVEVIEETLLNILERVQRPEDGIEVIFAYNTTHMEDIELRLKKLAYKWPELILANAYGSRSKSENLNYALSLASGAIVVLLDADHIIAKDCLSRAWRWLDNGYDVVQGRCKIRNGSASFVSSLVEVEFEAIYGISHYAKSKIFDSTLFGGTNGFWRSEVIKSIKFSKDKLTEDIDSTLRAILSGKRFMDDRDIISSELAPETLSGLWFQRKRWAQGWYQCSVQYQIPVLSSKFLNIFQKFMWTTLLMWRVFYDIASHFLWPIVFAFWLYKRKITFPMNSYIWFAIFFTMLSGPFEALVAFKNASRPRAPVSRFIYYAFLTFPYTILKNAIQVIAIRDELLKKRDWVISPRSKICLRFLSAILIIFFFVNLTFAEQDPNEVLINARKLVEEKAYDKALEQYALISDFLRRDPGLLIEWARVYTYADRHQEAIKLFEEIKVNYPQREKEILRELADQYKWSQQLRQSIKIYRETLKDHPQDLSIHLGLAQALVWNDQKKEALDEYNLILKNSENNKDALLGKADILSWEDKLEDALALYRQVLEVDPGNISALNSQARVLVWQGYHRKGIAQYQRILKDYPRNIEALEGLAFAYHWDGQNSKAVSTLNELLIIEPDRQEAKKLSYQIKNAQAPFVSQYNRFSKDTNPQTVVTTAMRSGLHIDYSTSIDAIYERQILRKKGAVNPMFVASRGGLGLEKYFGDSFEFNTFVYGTNFTKTDFAPFTTNTWFTYKPGDMLRFDLAYDRETFEDNDALTNKIITNSASLSADLRPNRFWLFGAKYKRGYYTDENRQNQVLAKAEYRLNQKPYLKLYYNYYYSDWGEPELSHGYFNPRSINSHTLGFYSGVDLTDKLFAEAQVSGGYEFQKKPDPLHKISNHPTCFVGGGLSYRLSGNWLLLARGEMFTAWPDHGQKSYIRKYVYLSLTYNFGANPPALRDATRTYRGNTSQ